MRLIISLIFCLSLAGCMNLAKPETPKQVQVASYSQVTTLALSANQALVDGVISAEQHKIIHDKLNAALILINETSDLVEAARLLGEVAGVLE